MNGNDKNANGTDGFSRLRKRAEETLKRRPADLPDPAKLSDHEMRRIIHELKVHQVELETQNDELLRVYKELELERNRYSDLYDYAPVGYVTIGEKGLIREINRTGSLLLGIEKRKSIGMSFFRFIAREHQDAFYLYRRRLLEEKARQSVELKMNANDGNEFYAQLECRPAFDSQENIKYIRVVIVDITVRKRMEEQLKASLVEKEVMLKEIHHRVKNNLAIIHSLLALQVDVTADEAARRSLQGSRDRVKAMALAHEKLYSSPNLAKLDITDYIQGLLSYIFQSYITEDSGPTLNTRVDNVAMEIDKAVPCGMIINELVSNALKYAFPNGEKGAIGVELSRPGGGDYRLRVHDNGIGLPQDLEPENTGTLGLQLVSILVKQLNGTMEISRSGGTAFTITFP
jgi:PAS domain S-box-containing protein